MRFTATDVDVMNGHCSISVTASMLPVQITELLTSYRTRSSDVSFSQIILSFHSRDSSSASEIRHSCTAVELQHLSVARRLLLVSCAQFQVPKVTWKRCAVMSRLTFTSVTLPMPAGVRLENRANRHPIPVTRLVVSALACMLCKSCRTISH